MMQVRSQEEKEEHDMNSQVIQIDEEKCNGLRRMRGSMP